MFFLFLVGFFLAVGVWLGGLRPYLSSRGLRGSGADYGQSLLRDWTIAGELARKGDRDVGPMRFLVSLGLFLMVVGVIGMFF